MSRDTGESLIPSTAPRKRPKSDQPRSRRRRAHTEETLRRIEAEIPRLRRFARYIARDPDLADDLVQECLLRAISRLDTWQPGTNLRAWLLTILRNVFLTELRRGRRAPVAAEVSEVPAPAHAGEQEFTLYLSAVQQAFERLSGEHRDILLLVAVEELTYEEAASVLEIPIGTVRSRLSRARGALRELLHGMPATPELTADS